MEERVNGQGEVAGRGQEIDYRGNHLYSSGAVAKRPNFPAKTTEYHLQKGALRTEKVFYFKASDVGQESGIDLQFRIVGQVGRRRDFFPTL